MWLCLEGLTDGSLQGAYGVVRLAYNESEDRHYVSLGLEGVLPRLGPRSRESKEKCWERDQGRLLGGGFCSWVC